MIDHILTCPCGSPARAVWRDSGMDEKNVYMQWWVRCSSQSLCLLYTPRPTWTRNTEAEAIAHWNEWVAKYQASRRAPEEGKEVVAWTEKAIGAMWWFANNFTDSQDNQHGRALADVLRPHMSETSHAARRPSPHPAEGETPEFEGLSIQDVAARLMEQYGNAVDIAGRKKGDDRESWLDDARHYKAALGFLNFALERRLRASQPVAEGVVDAVPYEPTEDMVSAVVAIDPCLPRSHIAALWRTMWGVFRRNAHPAPAPEGGTLPPEVEGAFRRLEVHAKNGAGYDLGLAEAIHSVLAYVRSSLRAAGLGRGAVDFHPDRLPPMDAKGYFWHPDLNIIAPDESVTWASAKLAARAAGFELTVVEYMEWVPDNEMADVHDWPREKPEGEGWRLIAKADSEDGPIAVFIRAALPSAPQLKGGEA